MTTSLTKNKCVPFVFPVTGKGAIPLLLLTATGSPWQNSYVQRLIGQHDAAVAVGRLGHPVVAEANWSGLAHDTN